MLVDAAQLEACLAQVRAEVTEPRAGIHGPGSASWAVERDLAIFLGGGRAALLQLAHPFVAYGVDQHSRTRADVVGRFRRTFAHVFAMAFGTLDDAMASARRVHRVHTRVHGIIAEDAGAFPRGTRYAANDSAALTWVWATLVDTVVTVHAAVGQPLAPAARAAYYQSSKRFARLFGLTDAMLPPDWRRFAAYVDDTVASSVLTVTAPARDLAGFLFGGALGPIVRTLTAGLLPATVRAQYGLPFARRDRVAFAAVLGAARATRAVTPAGLWHTPAYRDAHRRLRGLPPSAWSRLVEAGLHRLAGRTARG
ncbi:MAG: oxygenase MpaB family protein [Kofleriaceae bacterium]